MTTPHQWTDATGARRTLPVIDNDVRRRLKLHGIVDLFALLLDGAKWTELFGRLADDAEFIINFAYVMEHAELGTDEQQEEYAGLFCGGESGGAPLIECGDALREAVIDFFPPDRRDAIRRLYLLETTQQAMAKVKETFPDYSSEDSDSRVLTSGMNPCSESSGTTETGSLSDKSVSDMTQCSTTTE